MNCGVFHLQNNLAFMDYPGYTGKEAVREQSETYGKLFPKNSLQLFAKLC